MSRRPLSALVAALLLWVPACQPSSPAGPAVTPAVSPVAAPAPREEPSTPAAPSAVVPASHWCLLSGATGMQVRCPVVLAFTGETSPAAGLQLRLAWDAEVASLEGIESQVCPPAGPCATVMSPPLSVVGSLGHTVATKPPDLSTAKGAATLMIYHASNPNAALGPEVGALVFRLHRAAEQEPITLTEALATSPAARTLSLGVEANVLRVAP